MIQAIHGRRRRRRIKISGSLCCLSCRLHGSLLFWMILSARLSCTFLFGCLHSWQAQPVLSQIQVEPYMPHHLKIRSPVRNNMLKERHLSVTASRQQKKCTCFILNKLLHTSMCPLQYLLFSNLIQGIVHVNALMLKLNPFTPNISLVIFLIVCRII